MPLPQIRQGDVALIPRAPLTAAQRAQMTVVPRDNGRVILAYGEVTGHAHALVEDHVTMYRGDDGQRVLTIDPVSEAILRHEEHTHLTVPPGDYTVVQQREYTPEAVRNVAD